MRRTSSSSAGGGEHDLFLKGDVAQQAAPKGLESLAIEGTRIGHGAPQ
jgi:hypothetical protein